MIEPVFEKADRLGNMINVSPAMAGFITDAECMMLACSGAGTLEIGREASFLMWRHLFAAMGVRVGFAP
jgi:hypothetical protein